MPSGAVAATAVPPGLRARRGIRAPGVRKSPKPALCTRPGNISALGALIQPKRTGAVGFAAFCIAGGHQLALMRARATVKRSSGTARRPGDRRTLPQVPAVVRVTSVPGGPFSTARPGMDARPHGPMDAAVGGPNSAFGD